MFENDVIVSGSGNGAGERARRTNLRAGRNAPGGPIVPANQRLSARARQRVAEAVAALAAQRARTQAGRRGLTGGSRGATNPVQRRPARPRPRR